MVERDRNADSVSSAQRQAPPDKVAVVDDVVVRERRGLGIPRRAGRKLDVDRVVDVQRGAWLRRTKTARRRRRRWRRQRRRRQRPEGGRYRQTMS